MGVSDRGNEGRGGFKCDFSEEGLGLLKKTVQDKLMEFMGNYTDDILVDYVVLLVKKSKDAAEQDLNAFLGEKSSQFVSWLWDHLSSNLNLYVKHNVLSSSHDVGGSKTVDNKFPNKSVEEVFHQSKGRPSEVDNQHGGSVLEPRNRRKREWKSRDSVELPSLLSSDNDRYQPVDDGEHLTDTEEKPHTSTSRGQRGKYMTSEMKPAKRELDAKRKIGAPRRLLQFAVREALAPSRPSKSRMEPAPKRLRSVVSSSQNESYLDSSSHHQLIRAPSVATIPRSLAAPFKAAVEAAQDSVKSRAPRNAFERLKDRSRVIVSHKVDNEDSFHEREEYDFVDSDPIPDTKHESFRMDGYDKEFEGDLTNIDREADATSTYASENKGYDNDRYDNQIDNEDHFVNVSQTSISENRNDDSLMVEYSVNRDEILRKPGVKDTSAATIAASSKIVNISVNVNTWKPAMYPSSADISNIEGRTSGTETGAFTSKPAAPVVKGSDIVMSGSNETSHGNISKEAQKTALSAPGTNSYTSIRPLEDAESRSVYVSNVHFAATKDLLSRHFNRCGEVLKVVIVTDAATGQPKGSAYVEFMRKEAANLAVSLNGTSFMSRILKVVPRSSLSQEASAMLWAHYPRATPFPSRFTGVPYPRASAFRRPAALKVGRRSLQWRRDSPTALTPNSAGVSQAGMSFSPTTSASSTPRASMTYVRPESNQGPNQGAILS